MDSEALLVLKHRKQRIEALDADLSGSAFTDVKLTDACFQDVNLSGADFSNCNLSGGSVHNANLHGLGIRNANLAKVAIAGCVTDGMTIDGIAVSELQAAYAKAQPKEQGRRSSGRRREVK